MTKLFYGNEPYLLAKEKEKIIRMASDVIEVTEVEAFTQEIVDLCFQQSFFTEKRIIVITCESLEKNVLLEEYLKKPALDTDLYMFAEKANKSLKVFKAFDEVLELRKISSEQLRDVIVAYVEHFDCNITEEGFHCFTSRMNYYDEDICLFDVFCELDKLIAYSDVISKEVVGRVVEERLSDNIFSLTNLYFNGTGYDLMRQVKTLQVQKGFSSIAALSLLLRSFRVAYKGYMFGMRTGLNIPRSFGVDKAEECVALLTNHIRAIKAGNLADDIALQVSMSCLLAVKEA